tara:strand:- start:1061 stop:1411 length:351 start_codon:yes stop_codon:yes gene_type:complete
MNKIILAIIIVLTSCHPVHAAEWNNKPVICANEQETFSAMASKGEVLIGVANQLTPVNDPDENNGISTDRPVLPWALYANLETGTFTVLEYHNAPYNTYCTIGHGVEFKFIQEITK